MSEALRKADLREQDFQDPPPIGRQPGSEPASDPLTFEQVNAVGSVAVESSWSGGDFAPPVGSPRSADFDLSARENLDNFPEQLATTCRSIALILTLQLRRIKEDHPLRLLGLITGVAFAGGITVRIWRSSHDQRRKQRP